MRQQPLGADDVAGIGDQDLQQPRLELREPDGLRLADAQRQGLQVEVQRSDAGRAAGFEAGAPQQRAHPREEGTRAERLGQVIVRAEVECAHEVLLLAAGRQHHDRNARLPADRLADVEAAAAGQVDVEDGEVRRLARERAQRGGHVGTLHDDEARLREREADQREQVVVVIDDEDLHVGVPPAVGSATSKRDHPSSVRVAATRPPWRSTIDFTIHKPSPSPLGSGSCSAAR